MDLLQSIKQFRGLSPNLQAAGGMPDCRVITDAAISAGDPTLTSASNPFTDSDVSKVVCVVGAGTAGADLVTTIASITNGGSVELAVAAATTVTAAVAIYGTDNKAAFADLRSKCAAAKRRYWIPSGWYLTTETVEFEGGSIEIEGDGRDNTASSVIVYVGSGPAVYIHPPVGTYYCYAANITHVAIACFGGSSSALKLENVSQADYFRVGMNQIDGAKCDVGWDLINPNILRLHRPITQNCQTAFKISSTGSPDSATNFHLHGGNIYRNETVFDFQANVVKFTVDGVCHIEQFTTLVKLNRDTGAADLQINSFSIDNCEVTASTGGYTSKLFDVTVPGTNDLIFSNVRFTRNWVFFGESSPALNPIQFTFGGVGTVVGEIVISGNEFSNIDTSLIDCVAPGVPAFNVYWHENKKRFGSAFVPLSAGSTAILFQPAYGGDTLTSNTAIVKSKAGGFVEPIAGLEWFNDALHISRDPNATTGQVEIADAAVSRAVRLSVPISTHTALLKFGGALSALAINGLLAVGTDEQPTVTLYVHNNNTGGHTQLQVKANAADGSLDAIINAVNTGGASAFQVMGGGDVYFPIVGGSGGLAALDVYGKISKGKASATSSSTFDATGLTNNELVKASGGVLASATGASAILAALISLGANLVMATDGSGVPTTTTYASIYGNLYALIAADFVTPTQLATYTYIKDDIDGMIANLQSQIDGKSGTGHTHSVTGACAGTADLGTGAVTGTISGTAS